MSYSWMSFFVPVCSDIIYTPQTILCHPRILKLCFLLPNHNVIYGPSTYLMAPAPNPMDLTPPSFYFCLIEYPCSHCLASLLQPNYHLFSCLSLASHSPCFFRGQLIKGLYQFQMYLLFLGRPLRKTCLTSVGSEMVDEISVQGADSATGEMGRERLHTPSIIYSVT